MALPGKRKSNPNTNNQKKLPTQDDFFSSVDDGNYLDDSDLQSNIQYNNQYQQQPDYNMYQQQNYVPQTDYYEGTQDRALDSLKTRTPDRIDHKKKKIIPTGGERAKVNDKNLDDRKNTLVFLKVIRFILLLVIFGLFGLGIKNTFFPAQIYTNEDIENIVKTSMGETGFPKDRGRAYAQEYLNAYLNSTQSKLSRDVLSKLENNIENNNNSSNNILSGKSITNASTFLQKPFYYPTLFSEKVYTLNSAVYKFSVFMTNSNGELTDRDGNLNGSWVSFQVSVAYDEKTDSLSVVEAPTLIPNYNKNSPSSSFYYKKPGTGEQSEGKITEALKSTVYGFLEAYSKSSFKEHSALDQYIPHDKPIKLINGFNNTVKLETNSVNYITYDTKKENEWKLDITLSWLDLQSSNNSEGVKYESHYLMTVQKTEDNVYLVTDFVPYPNIRDESQSDKPNENKENNKTKETNKK